MKRVADKYYKKAEEEIEAIGKRAKFLVDLAERVERYFIPPELEIEYCPCILLNVVSSYFYDKERHNDFHGSNQPNAFKKAAFLCKWISKLKPFRVIIKDEKIDNKALYDYKLLINEIYCTILFTAMTEKMAEDYFDDKLIYELHYGHATSNMLMVVFERNPQ
jgi:hypothetical protein